MTIQDLQAHAKAGNVTSEDAPSTPAAASPAKTPDSSPEEVDQYVPIMAQLQSTQQWLTTAPTFVPQTFQDQIQFVYDGTDYWIYFWANNQWNKVQAGSVTPPPAASAYNNGHFTRTFNAAGGFTTIAHGLGAVPKNVRITAIYAQGGPEQYLSTGSYNGTTMSVVFSWTQAGAGGGSGGINGTSFVVWMRDNGGNGQTAVIAVDSTDIILLWTLWGTPGPAAFDVMWEANS